MELLRANGGRCEILELLFAGDAASVADSEKLCRLMSEFDRVGSVWEFDRGSWDNFTCM